MKRIAPAFIFLFATVAFAGTPDLERLTSDLTKAVQDCRRLATRFAPYDVAFRRDPMRPLVNGQGQLVSSAGLSGGLSVQGIMYSEAHPLAMVDDDLYSAGQAVGSYTILSVERNGVTVQRAGAQGTQFIPLDHAQETPQPPAAAPVTAASPAPETAPSPAPAADPTTVIAPAVAPQTATEATPVASPPAESISPDASSSAPAANPEVVAPPAQD